MPGKSQLEEPGYVSCPACSSYHLPTKRTIKDGVYAADCVNCGHFFKFKATMLTDAANSITFTVNGKTCTVSNEYAASTTLVHYLRETRLSMGTKAMCYEGGCGLCLVVIAFYHPQLKKKLEVTVNSCLTPLYSCDGHDITTIEGLGSIRDGLHPIQDMLAKKDGAQCGYCSSGQVMNMFGILKGNAKPTVQEVEDSMDATICRCTGYRSILDAMKSFAVDAPPSLGGRLIDIEELDTSKLCHKNGKPCRGQCSSSEISHCHDTASHRPVRPVHIVNAQAQWFKPTTLADLAKLLNQYKTQKYRLTFGNTGTGVYKELALENYDVIIDIRAIDELYGIQTTPNMTLGANLSINNVMDVMRKAKDDPSYPWASQVVEHWTYVAMNGIRNLGCWAGNVMMKHLHNELPSDIFTCLETIGTQLLIMDENGSRMTKNLTDFLKLDMRGKVIVGMIAPAYTGGTVQCRTYRTSLRLQACHTYTLTGFRMDVDSSQNYLIKSKPSIVVLGIDAATVHATLTENYLVNKKLGDPAVLKNAFKILASELKPDEHEGEASGAYRKGLALGMFYKCCLDICKDIADPRYVSGGPKMARVPMVGTQDYGTQKKEWPITQPMPKTTAGYLTSGAPAYVDDVAPEQGQLHAAAVLSIYGNATVSYVDPTAALAYPGVVKYIRASDIPEGGVNNWRGLGIYAGWPTQELLSTGAINYAGQPIGIIVADRETTARHAVTLVKVSYVDIQPALTDLKEAVDKKSFFPDQADPTTIGDPTDAIRQAPHKISGTMYMGDQYHYYMESQTNVCSPTDTGGMKVKATTQWMDGMVETVAQILGKKESDVTVELERLGGAFGGKISQNFHLGGMCALAAHVCNRPVKMHLDIHENMKMFGKRPCFYATYEIGVDNSGKLLGIKVTLYEDMGVGTYDAVGAYARDHMDNAYFCPNWMYTPISVKTNKPASTWMRTPLSLSAILMMETMMEHVASELKMDYMDVRKINLYVKNQTSPWGEKLLYCNVRPIVAELEASANVAARAKAVAEFNKNNRWKKRGLGLMPYRYGLSWLPGNFNTMVTIFHGDGSVAICHGGIDSGQGMDTKAIQVAAHELGIPMDLVRVKTRNSIINANSYTTGGSVTSELVCKGVIECCNQLKARMAPVKAKMKNPTWTELTAQCQAERLLLNASYMTAPNQPGASQYSIYSCAVSEAEIDVLTGQYQIRQTDMLYDAGQSTNPELDIGQAEGAFVMGLGYLMQEGLIYHSKTGVLLNASSWEYKPPLSKDVPMKYNIKFLRDNPNVQGVLNSRTVGEPPLNLAMTGFFAVKHAIESARAEVGKTGYFTLESPCTPERVQMLCMNDVNDFALKPAASSSTSRFWRK